MFFSSPSVFTLIIKNLWLKKFKKFFNKSPDPNGSCFKINLSK